VISVVQKKGFRKRFLIWILCWIALLGGVVVGALELVPALIIGLIRDEFRFYLTPRILDLASKIETG